MTKDDYLRLKCILHAIQLGKRDQAFDIVLSWLNAIKNYSLDYDPSWDYDPTEDVLNRQA